MNKLRILKLTLALAIVLAISLTLMVGTASASIVKITYKYGTSAQNAVVNAGEEFTPITPDTGDDIFYGWVDSNGVLYQNGQSATLDSDTVLYLASGCEVSNAEELLAAVASGKTYVKLTDNISLFEQLCLENGIFVIDTNGYTLTINTDSNAITGKGLGLVFTGKGAVKHNYMGATPEFTMDSFIKLSPASSIDTLFVSVLEGTQVSTVIDFISITSNIDKFNGAFDVSIYGSLECNKLLRTQGISGADFTVYPSATITTGCEFLFEDISSTTANRLVNLTVYGGTFNLDRLSSYAKDHAKYQAAILGGSFSEDITNCFPNKNYSFSYNAVTGYYDFGSCNHYGIIIGGMPDSCFTPNVVLTYECRYCNTVYVDDKSFVNGIGHFYVTEMVQPLIANEEITQPCINKTYCKRCGEVKSTETIYPDPREVYVTVVYLDDFGKEQSLRVQSTLIFKFDDSDSTFLKSFGTEPITSAYQIRRADIISVEIPMGTTKIYGDSFTHRATGEEIIDGVFYDNPHLREVVIPGSVREVQKNAFREMKSLTSLTGVENITGTIGERAFYQKHTNVVIDQLELNSRYISNLAFNNIRINSLTIGLNVLTIETGAFALTEDAANGITAVGEVFVEGNTVSGITVHDAIKNAKVYDENGKALTRTCKLGQQFDSRNVVFTEHQCDSVVTPPTCISNGYTTHTCKHCSYVRIDSVVNMLGHTKDTIVEFEPTCTEEGYRVEMCTNCGKVMGKKEVFDLGKNEVHKFDTKTCYVFADENGNLAYYQSFSTPYKDKNTIGFYGYDDKLITDMEFYVCENTHAKIPCCERCGKPDWEALDTIDASEWKEPLGEHKLDTSKRDVQLEPNCGDEGWALTPCSVCSKKIEEPLPVTGKAHKWGEGVMVVVPNCTTQGIEEFRCTVCSSEDGIRRELRNIDPDAHNLDEGTVSKPATEQDMGIKVISCTRCDYFYEESIEKLPPSASAQEEGFPVWLIIVISVSGVLLVGGVLLTLYFTLFKKKRASDKYKYKFNTLGK